MPRKRKQETAEVLGMAIAGGILSHRVGNDTLSNTMVTRKQKKALGAYFSILSILVLLGGGCLVSTFFGMFSSTNNTIWLVPIIPTVVITGFVVIKILGRAEKQMGAGGYYNLSGVDLSLIKTINEYQFERLVAQTFKELGNQVELTGQTGDHGVDVKVWDGDQLIVVQCKRFNDKAGESIVRDLHGAMHNSHADGAYLFCTGGFTDPAKLYAQRNGIKLFDANDLLRMIQKAQEQKRLMR